MMRAEHQFHHRLLAEPVGKDLEPPTLPTNPVGLGDVSSRSPTAFAASATDPARSKS